jgi:hypothetical protein
VDPYTDDRLKSDKPTTLLGFIDTLKALWESAEKPGSIVRNHVKSDQEDYPIITYKIKRRIPHPAFKERKPRLRQTIKHPYRPNESVEIYGQIYQVFVEFKVHSSSDEEADKIAVELEEFLLTYKGFFKREGVKELYFLEQGEDETDSNTHIPVATRTMIYDMQFEKVTPRFLNQIEQLAIQANILDKNNTNNEEES